MFNINSFDLIVKMRAAGENFENIKVPMIYCKICTPQAKNLETFRKIRKNFAIRPLLNLPKLNSNLAD